MKSKEQPKAGVEALIAAAPYTSPYITLSAFARAHNVSPQYVSKVANAGRIEGAVRLAERAWIIPRDARILPPLKACTHEMVCPRHGEVHP